MMAALAQAVPLEGMRERFEAKGRFAPWLQQIPLQRVVTPFMELRGAAAAYCH
jgi:glucokinase